jgi:hypothetical protein
MKKMRIFALVAIVTMMVASAASAQGISNLPGGGWWSGEQVQNVGSEAATINIAAYHVSNSSMDVNATVDVDPGKAFTFTPFTGLDGMDDGFQGSAVVSSNQPIKAIVNVTNLLVGSVGVTGGTAAGQYQGIDGSAVADTLYFPLAKGDYYGATTTFYVQNAGDTAATIVATFAMNDGNEYVYTSPAIEPNRIAIFSVFNATGYDKGTASGGTVRLGALTVTSAQPLAGVVMEHSTTDATAKALFATRGFTANDFDTTAYAPVIKNTFYGQFTGLQVQNVSASNIDVTVTYLVASGPNVGESIVQTHAGLAPGKSVTFVQLDAVDGGVGTFLDAGDLAGATITATGNFVAIINEQNSAASVGITYSAMPDGSATHNVSAPLFKDNYYNSTSGLQIQNVGSVAASATAVFACTRTDNSTFTATSDAFSIPASGTFLFYRPSTNAATGGSLFGTGEFLANANCSVSITADQNIVAIVNEAGINANASLDNNNYEGFNLQ